MWNRADNICYCLDSILSQALEFPFEIVVVDDCSTDNSCSIVKEIVGDNNRTRLIDSFLANDLPETVSLFRELSEEEEFEIRSRIRLICLEINNGAATARNRGMEESLGEFIWFVDSDDFIAAGSLKRIKPIISTNRYDIIRFFTKSSTVVPPSYIIDSKSTGLTDLDDKSPDDILFMLRSGTVWSRIYRKEFIGSYRFNQDYSYSEDSLFVWLTTLNAHKIAYLKDTLYGYMDNPSSLTSIKPYERFVCYVKVVDEYLSIIKRINRPKSYKRVLIKECEKRLYTHAFYTYDYDEITPQMWEQWYNVYFNVMVNNKLRALGSRLVSFLIWKLRFNKLIIIIFRSIIKRGGYIR